MKLKKEAGCPCGKPIAQHYMVKGRFYCPASIEAIATLRMSRETKKQEEDPTEAQRLAFGRLQDAGQMMICLTTAIQYARRGGYGATVTALGVAMELAAGNVKTAAEAHLETLKAEPVQP